MVTCIGKAYKWHYPPPHLCQAYTFPYVHLQHMCDCRPFLDVMKITRKLVQTHLPALRICTAHQFMHHNWSSCLPSFLSPTSLNEDSSAPTEIAQISCPLQCKKGCFLPVANWLQATWWTTIISLHLLDAHPLCLCSPHRNPAQIAGEANQCSAATSFIHL